MQESLTATGSGTARPNGRQRLAAALALLLLVVATLEMLNLVVRVIPWGIVLLVSIVLALGLAWYGLIGDGPARVIGLVLSSLILVMTAYVLLAYGEGFGQGVAIVAALLLAIVSARYAARIRVSLPGMAAPPNPVLFINPKSGGGKAEQFAVADEARARGIEPIELRRSDDLGSLARRAVADGADGLAMAGGDGSQAIIAAVAVEHDLPYACIPAGTRNHFALDLGVDRDDVVGALDAFVKGGERRVDLAEVNGRVFVNNVSLGLYAEAVQREGYREAKLRTILSTVPDVLGPDGEGFDLRWQSPSGTEHTSGAAVLVSNNRYRLGRSIGSGTRPRIDDGLLGVTVAASPTGKGRTGGAPQRPWREWSAPQFKVAADRSVPAGIDGEAASLDSPLRFKILPGVLRVRIAEQHPGASPSASVPKGTLEGVRALYRIVLGRHP
jgi:diacylglycerol kinase family enzyme